MALLTVNCLLVGALSLLLTPQYDSSTQLLYSVETYIGNSPRAVSLLLSTSGSYSILSRPTDGALSTTFQSNGTEAAVWTENGPIEGTRCIDQFSLDSHTFLSTFLLSSKQRSWPAAVSGTLVSSIVGPIPLYQPQPPSFQSLLCK
jgi:hypothetical protein